MLVSHNPVRHERGDVTIMCPGMDTDIACQMYVMTSLCVCTRSAYHSSPALIDLISGPSSDSSLLCQAPSGTSSHYLHKRRRRALRRNTDIIPPLYSRRRGCRILRQQSRLDGARSIQCVCVCILWLRYATGRPPSVRPSVRAHKRMTRRRAGSDKRHLQFSSAVGSHRRLSGEIDASLRRRAIYLTMNQEPVALTK